MTLVECVSRLDAWDGVLAASCALCDHHLQTMTADASSDSSTDGLSLSSGVVLPDVQQQQLPESDGFPALGNLSLTAASSSAHLNEVVPGLWIGDIVAATDAILLAERGVRQVVSVLRGSVELPAVRPTPFAASLALCQRTCSTDASRMGDGTSRTSRHMSSP